MLLDPVNPVDPTHPLNKNRESWWLTPYAWTKFSPAKLSHLDLLGKYNGANSNCSYLRGDEFQPYLSIGAGGNINYGNVYDFVNGYTVGITFQTRTLTPGGTSGGAVLIGKNIGSGSNGWVVYQQNGTINTNGVSSSSILALNKSYRCIVTYSGGTATIYLNGINVASGSHTVGSTTDALRIGFGVDNFTWQFDGWVWDTFISSRVWTTRDVAMDYDLSRGNYQGPNSPLRFWKPKRTLLATAALPANFTTSVGVGQNLAFVSPARFTTTLTPSVSTGGIGPLTPDGPAEFETTVGAGSQFVAGQPTLVNFNTNVGVGDAIAAGAPVEFETVVGVKSSIRTIANGDRRRLADRRYRR